MKCGPRAVQMNQTSACRMFTRLQGRGERETFQSFIVTHRSIDVLMGNPSHTIHQIDCHYWLGCAEGR